MANLQDVQQPRCGAGLCLSLRRARPSDVARIDALEREAAIRLADQGLYSRAQIEGVLQIGLLDPTLVYEKRYWVAEDDGEIVAVGGWDSTRRVLSGQPVRVPLVFEPGRTAVVRCAYVRPGYELSRAAREVVLATEAHVRPLGIKRFEFACCAHLTELANSLGYEAKTTVTLDLPNGQTVPFVWMTRDPEAWTERPQPNGGGPQRPTHGVHAAASQ